MKLSVMITVAIVAGLLAGPVPAAAQIGGMQLPGGVSLPTGGFSKDTLLKQAQGLLGDLTAMKGSDKLVPAQTKQVEDLLPKAQSLTDELAKPEVSVARLAQLAGNLDDLQTQVGVLKGFLK